MAHRCGGALAPENTLAGFAIAALLGCGGVEFDVMLSAEGTPWLIHDETLERTTNGCGKVCESTDAVLAGLDAGCMHHRAYAGVRLPRFEAALTECRRLNLRANIEIKPAIGHDAATATRVARMAAEAAGLAGSLLLSSFSEEALHVARREAPQLPRALLVEALPSDWHARCVSLGVIAVHANSALLTHAQAQAIKRAGLHLAVYTENAPVHAQELFAWGVDCLITDRPDIVHA
ncbi:MAG: Glycerophosphodiester phosphodiesterase [Proteobacteria bacterium]|nr:Glycerophosphodiester phosphodiesterase [Pseudomonadota bacterium]